MRALRALVTAVPVLLIGSLLTGGTSVTASDIWSDHDGVEMLPTTYRGIATDIRSMALPSVQRKVFDMSGFSPFCANATLPESANEIEPECNRWEEQELDMLLMYLDLIAVGMDEGLARRFYQEIRCLSRGNVRQLPFMHAWEVCFHYDYSEVVGELLAKYVAEDSKLPDVSQVPTSSRWFGSGLNQNKGSFLLNLFRDARSFRLYAKNTRKLETSCCRSCIFSNYFVNIEAGQCRRNPFGKHCCHKACKSLGRLKVGASSSTSHCCKRCWPMPCRR